MTLSPPGVQIGAEVRAALARRQPVVALETSVFVQGLPPPHHQLVAQEVLDSIRQAGAVPALTAVLEGVPWVGLDELQLRQLQTATNVRKASWRDLAPAISLKYNAATTVSSALALASMSGLQVLATGGLGGVHRLINDQYDFWDISADLLSLTRFPLIVVCSGIKNLADLPRTWELLESLSVPVIGWQTARLPAFYVADSGIPLSWRADHLQDVIACWSVHHRLGGAALLLVQPCPEAMAVSATECERWLVQAEAEAKARGCCGPQRTPFLLRCLAELSQGRTLQANRALLLANASLAAQLATELTKLRISDNSFTC
jgi:pseudouridine-5'-phosphate glycosidase